MPSQSYLDGRASHNLADMAVRAPAIGVRLGSERNDRDPKSILTWVNTAGDLFPGADCAWACGLGAGGSVVAWNHRNGIVFAGFGIREATAKDNLPRVLDAIIAGSAGPNYWRIAPAG